MCCCSRLLKTFDIKKQREFHIFNKEFHRQNTVENNKHLNANCSLLLLHLTRLKTLLINSHRGNRKRCIWIESKDHKEFHPPLSNLITHSFLPLYHFISFCEIRLNVNTIRSAVCKDDYSLTPKTVSLLDECVGQSVM